MGTSLRERLGLKTEKATTPSLDEIQRLVYAAWREQTRTRVGYEAAESYVRETYPDRVIVCVGDEHYEIPYTLTDDGVEFDVDNARTVEHVWTSVEKTVVITKTDDERHVAFGWAYVMEKDGEQVVDHSGEFIEKSEVLEDAAYLFEPPLPRGRRFPHRGRQGAVGRVVRLDAGEAREDGARARRPAAWLVDRLVRRGRRPLEGDQGRQSSDAFHRRDRDEGGRRCLTA